ncbi:MAG: hypothetical protein V1736_07560 [Pseudomonadota bacterium]
MITNYRLLKKCQESFIRAEGILPYDRAMAIFTAMWKEGVALGTLPLKNPMDGIDVDVRIAGVINLCLKKS